MEIQAFATAVAPQPHEEAAYAELVRFTWVSPQEVLGLGGGRRGGGRLGLPSPWSSGERAGLSLETSANQPILSV